MSLLIPSPTRFAHVLGDGNRCTLGLGATILSDFLLLLHRPLFSTLWSNGENGLELETRRRNRLGERSESNGSHYSFAGTLVVFDETGPVTSGAS